MVDTNQRRRDVAVRHAGTELKKSVYFPHKAHSVIQ